MKFQNKIFYKFIFPQEFPYALVGYWGVWTSATCTNLPPKINAYFVISRPNYIGQKKKLTEIAK
jgi:hypothetical protein